MEREIRDSNGTASTEASRGYTAQGARPLRRRRIRVEVEVPEALMGEFDLMVQEVLAGPRTRLTLLEQEFKAIETRGLAGLGVIHRSITSHPGTGQTRRLVRFLVGLYDGVSFPFDLSELRGLDTALANACLDILNYDRLALCNVDQHLPAGERVLEAWIHQYGWVAQPLDE